MFICDADGIPLERWTAANSQLTGNHSFRRRKILPPARRSAGGDEDFGYASGVIARKRARPADDLATRAASGQVEGRRLTDPEFLLFFLLLRRRRRTTRKPASLRGLLAMNRAPGQLAWLMADLPVAWPPARRGSCCATPAPYLHAPHRYPDARVG